MLGPSDLQTDQLAVSTAFNSETEFPSPYDYPPDTILHSLPDSVYFHVHHDLLINTFNTDFTSQLSTFQGPNDPIIFMAESAEVINCMLHVIYGRSCRHFLPSTLVLSHTFATLVKHGCSLASVVTPQTEIFQHLLDLAATEPLGVYILAASNSLESLAVPASFRALSTSMTDIDDSMATSMGPVYLLRLALLHTNRREAIKHLVLIAPDDHTDTPTCNAEHRRHVMRAYALAAAYLAWEAVVSADTAWITSVLVPLLDRIECSQCEKNMRDRIDSVLGGWAKVKSTI